MLLTDRFLRLDELESFLEDAERSAAANDEEEEHKDAEDRLGEGALCAHSMITLHTSYCKHRSKQLLCLHVLQGF